MTSNQTFKIKVVYMLQLKNINYYILVNIIISFYNFFLFYYDIVSKASLVVYILLQTMHGWFVSSFVLTFNEALRTISG